MEEINYNRGLSIIIMFCRYVNYIIIYTYDIYIRERREKWIIKKSGGEIFVCFVYTLFLQPVTGQTVQLHGLISHVMYCQNAKDT